MGVHEQGVERALAFDETEFGAESVKVAVALVSLARAYTKSACL